MAGSWARGVLKRTRGRAGLRQALVLVPPVAWMAVFLIIPMFLVFLYGLGSVDQTYTIHLFPVTLANYAAVLSPSGLVLRLIGKTFLVAGVQTLLSLVVGYAIAYYVARLAKERWRGVLMSLIVIPFWISFVVRIFGLFAFTTDGGAVSLWLQGAGLGFLAGFMTDLFQIGTFHMLVITLMYVWIPFMILPLFANLVKVDPQILEAAHDLGASRTRAFLRVTLPLTIPGILTGSILTFITSVGAFVEPGLVGGTNWLLVGNFIDTSFNTGGGVGIPLGAAASVLIIVSTILLISAYTRYAEAEFTGEVRRSRVFTWLRNALQGIWTVRPRPRVPMEAARTGGRSAERGPTRDADRYQPNGGMPVRQEPVGGVPRGAVERVFDLLVERLGKAVLASITFLMIAWFFLPLILVAVFSFNDAPDSFGSWQGFSLRWYLGAEGGQESRALFTSKDLIDGLKHSAIVGVGSALLALFFGLMAAYAVDRFRLRFKDSLRSVMYLGLVIPSIVLGISIAVLIRFLNVFLLDPLGQVVFGVPSRWDFGLLSIIVGHATFNIPLATIVLLIGFREFDRSLEEAAMNLGADEITTFLRVVVPNLMPAIVSALLLTFTFSFDEVPVTIFLQGSGETTLPVVIYGLLTRKWLQPDINAAATLILVLSIIFVIAANKVQRGGTIFRI